MQACGRSSKAVTTWVYGTKRGDFGNSVVISSLVWYQYRYNVSEEAFTGNISGRTVPDEEVLVTMWVYDI